MERKANIDFLRVISAFAVVTIHIVTAPVGNSFKVIDEKLIRQLDMIHNLLLWAVPVFFMITGYCLMRKQECTYKYCFKHIMKYMYILFTIGLFYALLEQIFLKNNFSFSIIKESVRNVVNGNLWAHMWFLYSIIGIYLVMPILHSFLKQDSITVFTGTSVIFFFTILLPSVSQWISLGIEFPFGGYLFYVCFGGYAARFELTSMGKKIIYILGIVSLAGILFLKGEEVLDYKNPAIALISVAIFVLAIQRDMKGHSYIRTVSECTLGIYLLHPLFINIVLKIFKIDLLSKNPYMHLLVFEVLILLLSFTVVYILKKVPLIRKII